MQHGKTVLTIAGKLLFVAIIAMILMIAVTLLVVLALHFDFSSIRDTSGIVTDLSVPKNQAAYLAMVGQSVSIIAAAVFAFVLFERKKDWSLGWRQANTLTKFLQGCLLGAGMITLSFLLIWLLQGVWITEITFSPAIFKSLVWGLLLFLGVAISEELLTRGYIQGLLQFHYGTKAAILVSSLLFAALHSMNDAVLDGPLPLINLFLAGMILALLRAKTSGLWMPIGFHLTWNFFQGNVYGFSVSGGKTNSVLHIAAQGSPLVSGGAFGAEGSIVSAILLIAAIYLLNRRYRHHGDRPRFPFTFNR